MLVTLKTIFSAYSYVGEKLYQYLFLNHQTTASLEYHEIMLPLQYLPYEVVSLAGMCCVEFLDMLLLCRVTTVKDAESNHVLSLNRDLYLQVFRNLEQVYFQNGVIGPICCGWRVSVCCDTLD